MILLLDEVLTKGLNFALKHFTFFKLHTHLSLPHARSKSIRKK